MTNDNHARRTAEAQVIGAALALVKKANWTIHKTAATALPTDFWNYLYLPCPELLLVPTIEDPHLLRSTVSEAVRAARSDALVVSLGTTARDERQASVRICMWSRIAAHWYGPHLPWLSLNGELWLVPDHRAPVDDEPSFRLGDGRLALRAAPFTSTLDRYRGLAAARALVNEALEG